MTAVDGANSVGTTNVPAAGGAVRRSRRAAEGPVDAVPVARQDPALQIFGREPVPGGRRDRRRQDLGRETFFDDLTAPHNLSIVSSSEFVRVSPEWIPGGANTVPSGADIEPVGANIVPVGARNAFGLEPLDVRTGGLGRLQRGRYLQYSLLGVGAAALSTGIIMTVSSINR